MTKFSFKSLEKKPPESIISPPEVYDKIEKEKAIVKKPKQAKKINFNDIPGEIIKYPMMQNHSPTIIKLMNVYEDIAGKTYRADKIGMCKAIIYLTIQLLHKYEKGLIK